MSTPMFGTILFAARGRDFAVLAADSLIHAPEGSGEDSRIASKVIRHPDPKIPLAIIAGGIHILTSKKESVPELILQIISKIKSVNNITKEAIPNLIFQQIGPTIISELQLLTKGNKLAKSIANFNIYIAVRSRGEYRIEQLFIDRTSNKGKIATINKYLMFPSTLIKFYSKGQSTISDDIYGPFSSDGFSVLNETDLTNHAKNVLTEGIEYEAANYAEKDRQCGRPIEIVIVNRQGTTMVSP